MKWHPKKLYIAQLPDHVVREEWLRYILDESVIHMALFAATVNEETGGMAGYRRRRGFRGEST